MGLVPGPEFQTQEHPPGLVGRGSASAGRMKVRSVYEKNPWIELGHGAVGRGTGRHGRDHPAGVCEEMGTKVQARQMDED